MSSLDMLPDSAVLHLIDNDTFEQIVEDQEPAIPCDSAWHDGSPHRPEAEWIVHWIPECCQPRIRFWCDSCLMKTKGLTEPVEYLCARCGAFTPPLTLAQHVVKVEPLFKDAA